MKNILLRELVTALRTNDIVKEQVLLQNTDWSKSCFELLSKLIHQQLSSVYTRDQILQNGTSVSYKTLTKIFKGTYNISAPIDPRTVTTLNKLSAFCGFGDWNSFNKHIEAKNQKIQNGLEPKKQLKSFLSDAIYQTFKMISELDVSDSCEAKSFYSESSNAWLRLKKLTKHYHTKGFIISNEFNPSTFELLDVKTDSIGEENATLSSKEFWLICWYDANEKRYSKRVKATSEYTYKLEKRDSVWKITSITVNKNDILEKMIS